MGKDSSDESEKGLLQRIVMIAMMWEKMLHTKGGKL